MTAELERGRQALGVRVRALDYPVGRPVRMTDGFGRRLHPILKEYRTHAGLDFAARTGDQVYAAADGTVIIAEWQRGYGNVVVISHGKVDGKAISTLYAHNSSLKVKAGQQAKRGGLIALADSTGLSTGPPNAPLPHTQHPSVGTPGVPVFPGQRKVGPTVRIRLHQQGLVDVERAPREAVGRTRQ